MPEPVMSAPDKLADDLIGTVWFHEGPPPRKERVYVRLTWVGGRQEVIIRRCDMFGRVLKGARAMRRHLGSFLSQQPTYQRARAQPAGDAAP